MLVSLLVASCILVACFSASQPLPPAVCLTACLADRLSVSAIARPLAVCLTACLAHSPCSLPFLGAYTRLARSAACVCAWCPPLSPPAPRAPASGCLSLLLSPFALISLLALLRSFSVGCLSSSHTGREALARAAFSPARAGIQCISWRKSSGQESRLPRQAFAWR